MTSRLIAKGKTLVVGLALVTLAPLLLTVAAPVSGAAVPGQSRVVPRGEHVGSGADAAVISRDSYGVPTITAPAMAGVWYGAGYAQAEDRLVQLELTRRDVEGTLAGLFGAGELSSDEGIRNFYYTPTELSLQFQALPAHYRDALREFSDGINAFVAHAYRSTASEKALAPYEFWVVGKLLLHQSGPYRPALWRPIDTLAIGVFLARDFGGGGGSELGNLAFARYLQAELTKDGDANAKPDAAAIFNDSRWINDPSAPTTVPSPPAAAATAAAAARPAVSPSVTRAAEAATTASVARLKGVPEAALLRAEATLANDRKLILATGVSLKVPSRDGSDAFVVAPSRTKDHHALLWGAPQEGFGTPSVDGEEYLHGPGYDVGGMYITGEPFILIGRNADIAWTTTSEELVDQRIYTEKVRFQPAPEYWFDHAWRRMTVIPEEINVAGQAPQPYTVYRTVDGPVFSIDMKSGTAFSMRFASWGRESGSLMGFAGFGADTNLPQFEASVQEVTTLHNFLYADNAGNIAFFGAGLVPIEPSFSKVDPRLPALGDGSEQWLGYVPFSQMPRSVNPAQGYLDNWNTKPSASEYYQQNGGDEYWGTIYRSSHISDLLAASHSIDIPYLEAIEHDIGQIDNGDNTRPAAPYFIPILVQAYDYLKSQGAPIADPATHPDLGPAIAALRSWNGISTLGSQAMSIFMNFLEVLERNVFEGGLHSNEEYTGAVNFSDASLGMGTYGGLGGDATYNLLYHILAGSSALVPCNKLCYGGHYFSRATNRILVESLNDAIGVLSGTGTQLGQNVPGFGTAEISKWGYKPALDTNWNNLDPIAVGVKTNCAISPSQNRSTYMQAIDVGPRHLVGQNVLPPGQSGFISMTGQPSAHLCDQVGLFNSFTYKPMPAT